jgi:hypothetical protein
MYGYQYDYVDGVPGTFYSYPSVYYRGYPAYYVRSSWYYQSPRGWVVFRSEPSVLYRFRVNQPRRFQSRSYSAPRAHPAPRRYSAPRRYNAPRQHGHHGRRSSRGHRSRSQRSRDHRH